MQNKEVKNNSKSFQFNYTNVVLYLLIGLGILILINRFPIRYDLTRSKIYTLSKVSLNLVENLQDPLRIKVFISKNLPPPYNDLEVSFRDLLSEYQEYANDNFQYTIYNVNEKDAENSQEVKDNIKIAQDYGIQAKQLQIVDQDQLKLTRSYMGIVIEYGDLIEKIDTIINPSALEYQITGILQRMDNKINSLLKVKEKIPVTLYLSDNLIQVRDSLEINGLQNVKTEVEKAFEKSYERNYQKIKLNYNSQIDQNTAKKLEDLGATPIAWKSFTNEQRNVVQAGKGFASILIEYKNKQELIDLLIPEKMLQIYSSRYSNNC